MALPLVATCRCGANIWMAKSLASLPSVMEYLLCPQCGRDNSRKPSLLFRLRWLRYRLRKRRSISGLGSMWGNWWDFILLPREKEERHRLSQRAKERIDATPTPRPQ